MALVDSKASFLQRCTDVSAANIHTSLKAEGVETFAQLAYACGTPKEPPSQAAFDAFAAKVSGVTIDMTMVSKYQLIRIAKVSLLRIRQMGSLERMGRLQCL